MRNAIAEFVSYWRQFSASVPPYVHPEDAEFAKDGDFDLTLLPLPVNGNLEGAEVLILMLNPGHSKDDYTWERTATFRQALLRNLSQENTRDDYPLLYLDPRFADCPGAGYWIRRPESSQRKREQQKLRSVVKELAVRRDCSIEDAQKHVAKKVVILQMCPYHSKTMQRRDSLDRLPSCEESRRLARSLVESGEKLIIAVRSVARWDFKKRNSPNLVVYPRSLAASASLTHSSPGGQAILDRLSSIA